MPTDCAAEGLFCVEGMCNYALDCSELYTTYLERSSGRYWVDIDGDSSAFDPMMVECDMGTAGGGWTLVLNYVHAFLAGGVEAPAVARERTLPLLGVRSPSPSNDERNDPVTWGHARRPRFWRRSRPMSSSSTAKPE